MAYRYYSWCHDVGVHMYLIPSLIILAIIICVGITYLVKASKKEKEFEEELKSAKHRKDEKDTGAEGSQL